MTILGTAIGGVFVNFTRRHPNADLPLIDYEAAILMEPATLVGTIFGVLLNVTFPEYIILVCLILLLTFTTYKTFQSGLAAYRKEKAAATARANELLESKESLIPRERGDTEMMGDGIDDSEVLAIRNRERRGFRPELLLPMILIWGVFFTYTLATDSSHGTSIFRVVCGRQVKGSHFFPSFFRN
jgi:hypothetical protein